ncbi:MAG: DUF6804 family protein [Bacteroidota bacterium]
MKIILALLLCLCCFDWPYGYYQLLRYSATIVFLYLAYASHQEGNKIYPIIFMALAGLFQPFLKIALCRTVWNVLDIAVAILLVLSIFVEEPKKRIE